MKAVVTTKGQVTIPRRIRLRLGIKPGQMLEFDETTAFVKATKTQNLTKMKSAIGMLKKELAGRDSKRWLELTRGPVALAKGDR